LQWIKPGVIEAETIGSLPTLRGEVEMPFTVRFRDTEHRDAILGTIRYGRVWDWNTGWVKDNAFDSLSKWGSSITTVLEPPLQKRRRMRP
jgi:hypothetical protein